MEGELPMDLTTARFHFLSRLPELHRMFRNRDDEYFELDFVVVALWMFGDRDRVLHHVKKHRSSFHGMNIREGSHLGPELCNVLWTVLQAAGHELWEECLVSLSTSFTAEVSLEHLFIHIDSSLSDRTTELVARTLGRIRMNEGQRIVVRVRICDDGLDQECGERLVQALEGFRFNCLHLEGITDRSAAWPIILEYACQSRLERLSLEPAQDISLAACLRPLRSAAAFLPYLTLKNCVLDGDILSALQSMSVRQLYLKKCSIREGQATSVARGIASNTSLHQLDIAGKEMDPMLPETLTKGIANNMTLQVLSVFPIPLVPTPVVPLVPEIFPALCRGIGRNCSVRRAELLVSSPMEESVMLELARSKTLLELPLNLSSKTSRGRPSLLLSRSTDPSRS